MDWITSDLHSEIFALLYPSSDENDPATGRQDRDAFVVKAKILFPKGRIFASFKQLD
jgi:hypothetical protein